ncbi:MAG: glutaredoxin domain-containing protein [Terrimicrobiaceae bacterium]|jgi:glutaredoxin|nr:glutathione S-transferase N-terminal domain-containing protein [Terrimicrobiaceae bacterium]
MTLYIKPWCPWCIDAVKWLNKRGIEFKSVDVLSDSRAYEHMRKISHQSLTPTLEMPDGSVLADFDIRQIERFLGEKK